MPRHCGQQNKNCMCGVCMCKAKKSTRAAANSNHMLCMTLRRMAGCLLPEVVKLEPVQRLPAYLYQLGSSQ